MVWLCSFSIIFLITECGTITLTAHHPYGFLVGFDIFWVKFSSAGVQHGIRCFCINLKKYIFSFLTRNVTRSSAEEDSPGPLQDNSSSSFKVMGLIVWRAGFRFPVRFSPNLGTLPFPMFFIWLHAQGVISSEISCLLRTEKAPVCILYFTYL